MKRILLLVRGILALVIFAIVLEFCARADDALSYGASFWKPYNSGILFSQGPMGRRGLPGAQYQKWHMNSLGYRGPELRPGSLRIACIGASETFGLYEPQDQEFPRQLERLLNQATGKNEIQVVNTAVVGDTVAAAAYRLPEMVERVHPSLVVIYPSAAAYIWLPWVRDEPPRNAAQSAPSDSAAGKFELRITERLRTLLKQTIPAAIQAKLRKRETEQEIEKNHYPVLARVPEENIARFRKHLENLVGGLRERGVEPVLVTHATYFGLQLSEADRDLMIAWRKFYPMLSEDGFLDLEQRINDAIRAVAAEQHIVLVDAAKQMPAGSKYFADFSHFTQLGAEIFASHLADGLKPLIDAQSRKESADTTSPQPVVR